MYRKDTKLRGGPSKTFMGIMGIAILLVIVGSIVIMNRSNNNENVAMTTETTNTQGGTVAVLAQANARRTTGATENNPTANEQVTPSFYTFSLPASFSPPTSVDEQSACNEQSVRKTTAQSGSITITLYENGRPNACNPAVIGDASLAFLATDTGTLQVQNKDQVSFCTKEQNPACPRGDGKLTLHFARSESANTVQNDLYIVLEDTAIQPDLNAQAQQLIDLLEQVVLAR